MVHYGKINIKGAPHTKSYKKQPLKKNSSRVTLVIAKENCFLSNTILQSRVNPEKIKLLKSTNLNIQSLNLHLKENGGGV